MFRYDVFIGSLGFVLACSPRQDLEKSRDLSSLFPDANRALGAFSIQLEKSRETNVIHEAKILVQQGRFSKQITLQLPMIHSQEQVTLSFLHQSQPSQRINSSQGAEGDQGFETLSKGTRIHDRVVGNQAAQSVQEDSLSEGTWSASRCTPSAAFVRDEAAPQRQDRTPIFQDASALFRIPLPLSVRESATLEVNGAGESWMIRDGSFVWDQKQHPIDGLELKWTREAVPENRYPLQTREKPRNLSALRIDGEVEHEIPVIWREGFVWIATQDVKPGSVLELHFDVPGTEKNLMLPQLPLPEDMKSLVMIPGCARDKFILERQYLSWNCQMNDGPVWAASYKFHQASGGMDFADWPELARLNPSSLSAVWDAGETLSIETYGSNRLLRSVPDEARRICMRATWNSNLAH